MLKAALHFLGTRLAPPIYGGVGSIIALHRVVPESERSRLSPNRALEITPESLEEMILLLKRQGYDFVPMDAVLDRLEGKRKFVAMTLDDGYRDNVQHALPVFERHSTPFTVYATRAFSEHQDSVWWFTLEEALLKCSQLGLSGREPLRLTSQSERESALETLGNQLRSFDRETRDCQIAAICKEAQIDPLRFTRELILSPIELKTLSQHPLATLGAHSVHHLTSRLLDESTLRSEFAGSKAWLQEVCGTEIRHLAYPFGGRSAVGAREFQIAKECGFSTAVTTRFANLFPSHRAQAWALPRLEISGNYRAGVFTQRATSGLLPAIRNRGRRVIVE